MVQQGQEYRRGAAIVEFTFVASMVLLFLFAIFEYGRLICVRQVAETACREGARFAVVNTADTTLVADTQTLVTNTMGGLQSQLNGFTIQVYQTDSSGANLGPPQNASFGQLIAVQIDGDYAPILPAFLLMPNTIHITTRATMSSEAN